jgi:CubicO group peptidase (beta-lactamase class C family)
MRIIFLITFISLTFGLTTSKSQDLYFPPISSAASWDTISPSSLGWCLNKVDNLYDYLEQTDTKGFIVLKDGKIVLEKYFGTFTKDSLWYWASAGKTITSFLVGKAQEENYLSITDTSSKYLGVGWTNCTSTQEDKIKIRNQLTMTSGLDDGVPNNHCTLDTCLNYLANAGTRWAYHNAPYTLLESVITKATGNPINAYTQTKLKTKTGMTGAWAYVDYDNVFFSKVRSMARFGLLMQNNCIWNNDTLLHDTSYVQQMTNTSQSLNLSYGYLWWLNGKSSYMLPTSQIVFPGSYAPAAPSDMFAGLGKNGQIVSISKRLGLVVVRMGNQATSGEVPTQLCNTIWEKLNAVMCNSTSINEINSSRNTISIFPNPTYTEINIIDSSAESFQVELINANGQIIMKEQNKSKIDISNLNNGLFYINIKKGQLNYIYKVIKQ